MTSSDTIVAQATPSGRGGVSIVRVSGPLCQTISQAIVGKVTQPRYAEYLAFRDESQQVIDYGLSLFFNRPHSFTGEDVLELHAHGGPVIVDLLLKLILKLGARLAQPGEFSLRAFLNNKMDLTQAEAIADLIDSASTTAARSALRSLNGEFSRHIQAIQHELLELRMYVEAAIDFPEEEVDFLADQQLHTRLQRTVAQLEQLQANAKQGNLLREGMTIVIAGLPNAGKSSLLNRLNGEEVAIVTDIAGTTRDAIKTHIVIDGLPINIVDTAGLRHSDDPVEQAGIQRTQGYLGQADSILLVVDANSPNDLAQLTQKIEQDEAKQIPQTVVFNKIDLLAAEQLASLQNTTDTLYISAKTGQGIEALQRHLLQLVGFNNDVEHGFIARRRHIEALNKTLDCLQQALRQFSIQQAGELLAEDLRQAHQQLCEITGEYSSDDLLGEIFANFCIGK